MSAICYFLYLLNPQSAKFKPFAEVDINLCGIVLLAPILGFKVLLWRKKKSYSYIVDLLKYTIILFSVQTWMMHSSYTGGSGDTAIYGPIVATLKPWLCSKENWRELGALNL